jgi:hypothetical protein
MWFQKKLPSNIIPIKKLFSYPNFKVFAGRVGKLYVSIRDFEVYNAVKNRTFLLAQYDSKTMVIPLETLEDAVLHPDKYVYPQTPFTKISKPQVFYLMNFEWDGGK